MIIREFVPTGFKPLWWKPKTPDSAVHTVSFMHRGIGDIHCEILRSHMSDSRLRVLVDPPEFYIQASILEDAPQESQFAIQTQLTRIINGVVSAAVGAMNLDQYDMYITYRYNSNFALAYTDNIPELPCDRPTIIGKYSVLFAEKGMQFALEPDRVFSARQVRALQSAAPQIDVVTPFPDAFANLAKIGRNGAITAN